MKKKFFAIATISIMALSLLATSALAVKPPQDPEPINADTLDGLDSTDFVTKVANLAVVAISGGEYTSPVDAINDIDNWCGTPSATNLCTVQVMPGVYELSNQRITIPSYVALKGSGKTSTLLRGTFTSDIDDFVIAQDETTLSDISISAYWAHNIPTGPITAVKWYYGGGLIDNVNITANSALTMENSTLITALSAYSNAYHTLNINNSTINSWNDRVGYGTIQIRGVEVLGSINVNINNSTIISQNTAPSTGIIYAIEYNVQGTLSSLSVTNSKLVSDQYTHITRNFSSNFLENARYANTQFVGALYEYQSTRPNACFNVFDENFLPVTCTDGL